MAETPGMSVAGESVRIGGEVAEVDGMAIVRCISERSGLCSGEVVSTPTMAGASLCVQGGGGGSIGGCDRIPDFNVDGLAESKEDGMSCSLGGGVAR